MPQQGLQLPHPDFLDEDFEDFFAFDFAFAFFLVAMILPPFIHE